MQRFISRPDIISSRFLIRKPLHIFQEQENVEHSLQKNLKLTDLLLFGIGGSIGSGVFVLSGLIANKYAGPGVVASFVISGFSCVFSAASYGELSCKIPSPGTSYAYSYHGLGEYWAVLAAWCLFLEYGISGAAVARAWGDKLLAYLQNSGHDISRYVLPGYGVNIFAGILQFITVIVLLLGMNIGKFVINVATMLKIVIIAFMVSMGFVLFNRSNLANPTPFGVSGVLRGSTACMFSFIGYDEVCCLAAESINPERDLPIAVFGTIGVITVVYAVAALALVGMQESSSISTTNGFSCAFDVRGYPWASVVAVAGELISLPLVVLISFVAQPRIQLALARDGLLPSLFAEVDSSGNLSKGIIVSGIACTLIAIFAPFAYLDDMISGGALFSCNLTNTSLIVVRRTDFDQSAKCCKWLLFFHILALIVVFVLSKVDLGTDFSGRRVAVIGISILFLVIAAIIIDVKFPEKNMDKVVGHFRVPFVPYTPLLGITVNYFLIAQLSLPSLGFLVSYLLLATVIYIFMGDASKCEWKSKALHINRHQMLPYCDPDGAAGQLDIAAVDLSDSGDIAMNPLNRRGV